METSFKAISGTVLKAVLEKALSGDTLGRLIESVGSLTRVGRESPENQLVQLRKGYLDGQLVLVIGAGVSMPHGLPSWDTLLQKLLISHFQSSQSSSEYPGDQALVLAKIFGKLFNPNPLVAARYLRNCYQKPGCAAGESFDEVVRKALYENFNMDSESPVLSEIVQLCVAPGKSPTLDSIITYNFDDLLESKLGDLDIEISYRSISHPGEKAIPTELPIYHVHGFLPQLGMIPERGAITLSEDVYHRQYTDLYNWSNLVQISKFSDRVCLFLGISLTDPNLRRLLDIAQSLRGSHEPIHFAIRKRYDRSNLEHKLATILDREKEILDDKIRASLDLTQIVNDLAGVMEEFETVDDVSFGITTMWIKEYDEIPNFLRRVRQTRIES